jgi:hypothetical protein
MSSALSVLADARSRALRTLAQGLALDVAAAVVAILAAALADVHWTRAWWTALGLLIVKTAIQTGVAYVARRVLPPDAVA